MFILLCVRPSLWHLFPSAGGAGSLPTHGLGMAGRGPGREEGSESWTTVGQCPSAHHCHMALHLPPPRTSGSARRASHPTGQLAAQGERARARAQWESSGGHAWPPSGGGQPGVGGQGRLAALQAQNHKLGRRRWTQCGRPRAQGDAVGTTDRLSSGAGGWAAVYLACHSQTVHPEGVLSGRVGQDHVRVVKHVQSIQG